MTNFATGKYRLEPNWHPKNQLFSTKISANLKEWLFDRSSLTQRLQNWCEGVFRVQVYQQQHQRPLRNEASRLAMSPGQHALVRQVHLYCGEQAVVFARTVIPRQSLVGKQRRLASLGQRSLGAILFADKSMQRSDIEIARVTEKNLLHNEALTYSASKSVIWGRRSVFTLRGHPLLVSELFLPSILVNGNNSP